MVTSVYYFKNLDGSSFLYMPLFKIIKTPRYFYNSHVLCLWFHYFSSSSERFLSWTFLQRPKNIYRSFSDAFHFVFSSTCSTIHIAGQLLQSWYRQWNFVSPKVFISFLLITFPEIIYRFSHSFPETSKLLRDRLKLLRHFIVVLFSSFVWRFRHPTRMTP